MKDVDALHGFSLKFEEGEFYGFASVHIEGEAYQVRIPLGDGRYHAQIVVERIILPAIASSPLERWVLEKTETS